MTVRIALLVEGKTEKAFIPFLRTFLRDRLPHNPKLDAFPCNGTLPTGTTLQRDVKRLLADQKRPADAVVAVTDIQGTSFQSADDAKQKMRQWVEDHRFYPHVALHDFEAWLLPYWDEVKRLAGTQVSCPGHHPEAVNHQKPPSRWLSEVFRNGEARRAYSKPLDAPRILHGKDLAVAALRCPELRALLETLLKISGGDPGDAVVPRRP